MAYGQCRHACAAYRWSVPAINQDSVVIFTAGKFTVRRCRVERPAVPQRDVIFSDDRAFWPTQTLSSDGSFRRRRWRHGIRRTALQQTMDGTLFNPASSDRCQWATVRSYSKFLSTSGHETGLTPRRLLYRCSGSSENSPSGRSDVAQCAFS